MNEFRYSTYKFDDASIISATIRTEQSLVSESLSADTLSLRIRSDETGDKKLYTVLMEWYHTVNDEGYVISDGNLENYTYGDSIDYYRDGVLYAKFFITQIERVGDSQFDITGVSAMGMLIYMPHKGGVYTSKTAGSLIDEIMSGTGFTYTVQTAVQNTIVNGYLPYGNKRDNLQQILFAIGASVTKTAAGTLNFIFNTPSTTKNITNDFIKLGGGSNDYIAPATKIALTEHLFYQNPNSVSEEVYTYASTATSAITAIFDEPVVPSTITADAGITIIDSGATYVTFTGTGSIYAIKYTHIQTEKEWNAATVNGEENSKTVSNATLVTATNSANVLARLAKFYEQRKQTNISIRLSTEKTGDYVTFDDEFGEERTGFISALNITMSRDLAAEAQVTTDWYPTDTGNNFNAYMLIQNTGTITVPSAARGKAGRLVLIGGFRGGQGGTAGEDGEDAVLDPTIYGSGNSRYQLIYGGEGGEEGGKGGVGGVGVMIYSVDIASLPSSFSVTAIGAGGEGGNPGVFQGDGSMGLLGGNTTVTINGTSYSSGNGTENTSGFINFIDGTFYGYPGTKGYDNDTGYGGSGATGTSGGSFTADGTTWAGGERGDVRNGSGYNHAYPSGGGGAAYGAEGGKGGSGNTYNGAYTGRGGTGATPATPGQASFPYGGQGGHGGGCGGGGGRGFNYYGAAQITPGKGGTGGSGSPGGQGADGAVLFYYGS